VLLWLDDFTTDLLKKSEELSTPAIAAVPGAAEMPERSR